MIDRIPYSYRITHIKSGLHYYGVRYAKNCKPDDLWKTYFTSSNYVKELIKKDGKECFIIQIRKTFNTVQEALDWEYKILCKVYNSPKYLNKHTSKCFSIESCRLGAINFGLKYPELKN